MSQLWRTTDGRTESEDRAILKQNSQFIEYCVSDKMTFWTELFFGNHLCISCHKILCSYNKKWIYLIYIDIIYGIYILNHLDKSIDYKSIDFNRNFQTSIWRIRLRWTRQTFHREMEHRTTRKRELYQYDCCLVALIICCVFCPYLWFMLFVCSGTWTTNWSVLDPRDDI